MDKKIEELYNTLKSFGLSQLDASLVADCINMKKECSWQNNDPITDQAVEKANKFIKENNFGFSISVSPSRFDKYIWEVKKIR
ncbi:MAG: hypothetical protein N3D10_03190 [Candidatus Micrarchaeota archaeon]|nr:hypothetical protein [Candidatus Micrarchaeota archaeon]